jgi:hypothetical protein
MLHEGRLEGFRVKLDCVVAVVFDRASERRSSFASELGVSGPYWELILLACPQPDLPEFLHLSVVISSSISCPTLGVGHVSVPIGYFLNNSVFGIVTRLLAGRSRVRIP